MHSRRWNHLYVCHQYGIFLLKKETTIKIYVLEGEQDQVTITYSPIIIFQVNIIKHLNDNSLLFKKEKIPIKNKFSWQTSFKYCDIDSIVIHETYSSVKKKKMKWFLARKHTPNEKELMSTKLYYGSHLLCSLHFILCYFHFYFCWLKNIHIHFCVRLNVYSMAVGWNNNIYWFPGEVKQHGAVALVKVIYSIFHNLYHDFGNRKKNRVHFSQI